MEARREEMLAGRADPSPPLDPSLPPGLPARAVALRALRCARVRAFGGTGVHAGLDGPW